MKYEPISISFEPTDLKVETRPVMLMSFYLTNDKTLNEKNRAICKEYNDAVFNREIWSNEMKYVSIDIETTGLNHDICQIIEFAAVVDDLTTQLPIEELPKFQTYILQDHYIGEPYALAMHAEIFKKIANWKKVPVSVCSPDELLPRFHTFLTTLGGYETANNEIIKINVAGKNFGNFDSKFLEKLPHHNLLVKFNHRMLDPTMLYFDPNEDEELPSTDKCMERAGIKGEVQHTALEDAIDIVKLLRVKYPRRK